MLHAWDELGARLGRTWVALDAWLSWAELHDELELQLSCGRLGVGAQWKKNGRAKRGRTVGALRPYTGADLLRAWRGFQRFVQLTSDKVVEAWPELRTTRFRG